MSPAIIDEYQSITEPPSIKKLPKFEGKSFPFEKQTDVDFQKMVYRLFYNEVKDHTGTLSELFDDAWEPKQTREKGRDGVLFKNRIAAGIIQCKQSSIGSRLGKDELAKEMVKFACYWFMNNELAPDPSNFTYYIVPSEGFDQQAIDLINNLSDNLLESELFVKSFGKVVKSYKEIAEFGFTDASHADLKAFLSKVQIEKVEPNVLEKWLSMEYQFEVLDRYFKIQKVVVSNGPDYSPDSLIESFVRFSYGVKNIRNSLQVDNKEITIQRSQTKDLIDLVRRNSNSNNAMFLWVLGGPGVGKSAFLKSVVEGLENEGFPTLAIKADEVLAENQRDISKQLGFEENIDLRKAFEKLIEAGLKPVLILDQIDALHQNFTTNPQFLTTFKNFLSNVQDVKGLTVIISCRELELKSDTILNSLRSLGQGRDSVKIEKIEEDILIGILISLRLRVDGIPSDLKELLRNFHALDLFCQIYQPGSSVDQILTISDLYKHFWKKKLSNVSIQTGLTAKQLEEFVIKVADQMMTQGTPSVKSMPLQNHDSLAFQYLVKEGILSDVQNRTRFFHQNFYEFCMVRNLQIQGLGLKDIVEKFEGSLESRLVIKLALEDWRKSDVETYKEDVLYLVTDAKIPFHIKWLVIQFLANQADPNDFEIGFFTSHITTNESFKEIFLENLRGSVWLELADQWGYFTDLLPFAPLTSTKEILDLEDQRMNVLYQIFRKNLPDQQEFIIPWLISMPSSRLATWLIDSCFYGIKKWDSPTSLAFLEEKFEEIFIRNPFSGYIILEDLLKWQSQLAASLLKQIFDNYLRLNLEKRIDSSGHHHFSEIIIGLRTRDKKLSLDLCYHIILGYLDVDSKLEKIPLLTADGIAFMFYDHSKENLYGKGEILQIFFELLSDFRKDGDPIFAEFFEYHRNSNSKILNQGLVQILAEEPSATKDKFYELLTIYKSKGWLNSEDKVAYWVRAHLNSFYSYFDDNQKAHVDYLLLSIVQEGELEVYDYGKGPQHFLSSSGRLKFLYFQALGEETILERPALKEEFLRLRRKFQTPILEVEPNSFSVRPGGIQRAKRINFDKLGVEGWRGLYKKYSDSSDFSRDRRHWLDQIKFAAKAFPSIYLKLTGDLIDQEILDFDYWTESTCGLFESNQIPYGEILELMSKAGPKWDPKFSNSIQMIWTLRQMMERGSLPTKEVFQFLTNLYERGKSPNESEEESESTSANYLQEGINNEQGVALELILRSSQIIEFQGEISKIARLTAQSKFQTLRAMLLHNAIFLTKISDDHALEVFQESLIDAKSGVHQASIFSLQYLVNIDFQRCVPAFRILTNGKLAKDEVVKIVGYQFFEGRQDCERLWLDLIGEDEDGKAMAVKCVHQMIEHDLLFGNRESAVKEIEYLSKWLNEDSEKVAQAYRFIHLVINDEKGAKNKREPKPKFEFSLWFEHLKAFALSKCFDYEQHFFLELLKDSASKYPEEVMQIMELCQNRILPASKDYGTSHTSIPVEISLTIYQGGKNKNNKELQARAMSFFNFLVQKKPWRVVAGDQIKEVA